MRLWKFGFGSRVSDTVDGLRSRSSEQRSSWEDETWEIVCPQCKRAYQLGVDAYLISPDDVENMATGAKAVVGNLNPLLIKADAVYSFDGAPSDGIPRLQAETKLKIRRIKDAVAEGRQRRWFCRRCGPETGSNAYPVELSLEMRELAHTLIAADPIARGDAAVALAKLQHPSRIRPLILALGDKFVGLQVEEELCKLCGFSLSSDLSGCVRAPIKTQIMRRTTSPFSKPSSRYSRIRNMPRNEEPGPLDVLVT